LCDHALMSGERRKEKQALNRLVRSLQTLRARLSTLQTDLRPEEIIDQVEALIEEAYALQKAAELELEKPTRYQGAGPKEKGGRPRQLDRDALVERLLSVYTFSGKRVSLSRNSNNRPSGPCYRFVYAILKLSQISTQGIEHVIEKTRAQHAKNSTQEK
jgi:hypothetical protein